jgi:hypothetical protein
MDLALAFGMPVARLRHEMTERELFDWSRYFAQKGSPWARVEELLARIVMILDLAHLQKPGMSVVLSEYMPRVSQVDVQRARVARAMEKDGSRGA